MLRSRCCPTKVTDNNIIRKFVWEKALSKKSNLWTQFRLKLHYLTHMTTAQHPNLFENWNKSMKVLLTMFSVFVVIHCKLRIVAVAYGFNGHADLNADSLCAVNCVLNLWIESRIRLESEVEIRKQYTKMSAAIISIYFQQIHSKHQRKKANWKFYCTILPQLALTKHKKVETKPVRK